MHTLPALARLKDAWPTCRFSWVINREWAPLLDGNPDLEEAVVFPRSEFRGMAGWFRFVRWCRGKMVGRKPDLTLDFQGLLRTAFVGRASKPGSFHGMSDAREGARWFYDRVTRIPTAPMHAVDRYLTLVDEVVGATVRRRPLRFSLPPGESIDGVAKSLQRGFVVLHPYARGEGKSLTDPQINAVCSRLAPRQVVLIGRREDDRLQGLPPVLNLVNKTSLGQLIWLIRQAACVVSVDSGPSHLAAALGKPLIAIHTWSDPRRVGPYRDDAWVWKNARLMQMHEICAQDEAFFRQTPKPLNDSDTSAIADLATSLSDSCA